METESSSDSAYYSPENDELPEQTYESIITCNCKNITDNCLILCYNSDTEQFELINCKKFNKIINTD